MIERDRKNEEKSAQIRPPENVLEFYANAARIVPSEYDFELQFRLASKDAGVRGGVNIRLSPRLAAELAGALSRNIEGTKADG